MLQRNTHCATFTNKVCEKKNLLSKENDSIKETEAPNKPLQSPLEVIDETEVPLDKLAEYKVVDILEQNVDRIHIKCKHFLRFLPISTFFFSICFIFRSHTHIFTQILHSDLDSLHPTPIPHLPTLIPSATVPISLILTLIPGISAPISLIPTPNSKHFLNSHPDSSHSHPDSRHFNLNSLHSHPHSLPSPHVHPNSLHFRSAFPSFPSFPPLFPNSYFYFPCSPHSHPNSTYSHSHFHIPFIPTLISCILAFISSIPSITIPHSAIPLIPFSNFGFIR